MQTGKAEKEGLIVPCRFDDGFNAQSAKKPLLAKYKFYYFPWLPILCCFQIETSAFR